MKKNILLLKGGGGTEHDVSLVSSKYIRENLIQLGHQVFDVTIIKDGTWKFNDQIDCTVTANHILTELNSNKDISKIDYCIPCIHGTPGETGEIPAFLEMIGIPYLGCGPEASMLCFNKISTKLWLSSQNIPNTPYIFADKKNLVPVKEFFNKHGDVYVKASSQGSSVGVYHVTKLENLESSIKDAFTLSPYVLVEKTLKAREIEVSAFTYKGKLHITVPGEIHCPNGFYDYQEKYSQTSKTTTSIVAKNISDKANQAITKMATDTFNLLNLKDLSRIDLFYVSDKEIYINEINTFPGMTPISMFPKMMENYGVKFSDFLSDKISG